MSLTTPSIPTSLRTLPLLPLAAVLGLAACSGSESTEPMLEDEPETAVDDEGVDSGEEEASALGPEVTATYYQDIKPILDARCVSCHEPGGIGPFAMTTYEEAKPLAPIITASVTSRGMPPWPADSKCREYEHDIALTDEQIALIQRWDDQGAPQGDAAAEAPPLPRATEPDPRADVGVGMTEDHVPEPLPGEIDEHYCFVLDWPESETRYITGMRTIPGNEQVLHHFVGVVLDPLTGWLAQQVDDSTPEYGFECGAGTGMGMSNPDGGGGTAGLQIPGQLFSVWVPGAAPVQLPEGTGIRIEPGSKLLLNMHYNTLSGDLAPDRTTFEFEVEDRVEAEGITHFVTDAGWVTEGGMEIPAGEESVVHRADIPVGELVDGPATLHFASMHMHQLGASANLWALRDEEQTECLLDIPRWDFDWQMNYRLSQPVDLGVDDHIRIQCEWDNSPDNQPVIGGEVRDPIDVAWGEDTYDEMCLGMVYLTPQP